MRYLILSLLILASFNLAADDSSSGPLFMKDLLGPGEFLEPWGIGVDFYTMDQPYGIKSLEFELPGVSGIDPSSVEVQNKIQHYDVQFDVWVTPFLNAFALLGHINSDTSVDLGGVSVPGIPIPLGNLPIEYDGTVYGLGFTLVYGSDRWFTSLTSTWTDSNLSGDFDSSVSSFVAQPRIGLVRQQWGFWVGGTYLDVDERHKGQISLPVPGLAPVPFSVELESAEKWNYSIGVRHVFSPKATLSLELGFGDRDHTLFNFSYRF